MQLRLFCLLFLSVSLVFGQIPNKLSKEDKVFGLSQFWQEANYSYVYFDKINPVKWNELYKQYITEVQQTTNDYEYYRVLQKFCAFLKDGHTSVWFPKYLWDNIYNGQFGDYHMEIRNFDGKAIVARINKSKSSEIPVGTEIIAVNGMHTTDYIAEHVFPYISASADHVRQNRAIEYLLEGYLGTKYDLKLKLPSGSIKDISLTVAKCNEKAFDPPKADNSVVTLNWKDSDIAHISLNTFYDWETLTAFQEKMPELRKAKGLILDLRRNGGGNSAVGKVILHYLTNDTIFYGVKSQSRSYVSALQAWNRNEYYHDFPYRPDTLGPGDRNLLKGNRIVIPTAILTGHNTGSAAEDFLVYADKQAHMTKIGEPTNGSTGMPLMINLPGGGWGRVCTKKDTYPDGREFVGIGIQPDIPVSQLLSDYIQNKDTVLEVAVEYLREKI